MNQKIMKMFKSLQRELVKHGPGILTAIGISGIFTTAGLAVIATTKAVKSVEKEKERLTNENKLTAQKKGQKAYEKVNKLTRRQIVKVTWKHYIPVAGTIAASTACLLGAHSTHVRRNAALAAAYKLSETALVEYKDKVKEVIGEKKVKEVEEKIAQDHFNKDAVSPTNKEIVLVGNGNCIFRDYAGGNIFVSSKSKIDKIINELNHRMSFGFEPYVSLNDFYELTGSIAPTGQGDILGWNATNGLIELRLVAAEVTDENSPFYECPCFEIQFMVEPQYDFRNLH